MALIILPPKHVSRINSPGGKAKQIVRALHIPHSTGNRGARLVCEIYEAPLLSANLSLQGGAA